MKRGHDGARGVGAPPGIDDRTSHGDPLDGGDELGHLADAVLEKVRRRWHQGVRAVSPRIRWRGRTGSRTRTGRPGYERPGRAPRAALVGPERRRHADVGDDAVGHVQVRGACRCGIHGIVPFLTGGIEAVAGGFPGGIGSKSVSVVVAAAGLASTPAPTVSAATECTGDEGSSDKMGNISLESLSVVMIREEWSHAGGDVVPGVITATESGTRRCPGR